MSTPGGNPTTSVPAGSLSSPPQYSTSTRIFGALFYAVASILIMMVNKVTLYVWNFPSVAALALAQFCFSIVSLRLMKFLGIISFPDTTVAGLKAVFPLPIIFVGNAITGLSGTKALSLPMFTVLRRTNMIITMVLERYLLSVKYSTKVKLSVSFMLFGSFIATLLDMQFDLAGYTATLLNNLFTSVGGVVTKLKLNKTSGEDDKAALSSVWGLMYLNSLIGTPLLFIVLVLLYPDTLLDAYYFEFWNDPQFVFLFLLSSAMGTILQFSIFYCTKVNSALTTVVTGVLKNVLTSYVGMLDDRLGYTFNLTNFIGVNLSMMGGIWYAYIQFMESAASSATQQNLAKTKQPVEATEPLADEDDEERPMLKS